MPRQSYSLLLENLGYAIDCHVHLIRHPVLNYFPSPYEVFW